MTDMVTVRFVPQAWINDWAVSVDAEGPTTFAVPAANAKDGEGRWLPDHSYESDVLREHPNAPEWIREWQGPFEIEIEHEDGSGRTRADVEAEGMADSRARAKRDAEVGR